MRSIIIFALFAFLVGTGFSQKPSVDVPDFDIVDFNKKFETAQWLVDYDNVAWKTTDVILQLDKKELERLGQEWFCFQDADKLWHAVYGKLTAAGYQLGFHFTMDPSGKIAKSEVKLDQSFLTRHARALSTGRAKLMATVPEGSPTFNQYIKENSDKTFSVWLFPAFQTDGLAAYGGEGIYTIDQSGQKVTKDESYFQLYFRGFKTKPLREVQLNYSEMKKPSLGAIFFVWYYKSYFTNILIDNEKSTSTLVRSDKGYVWVHVEKDSEKPK